MCRCGECFGCTAGKDVDGAGRAVSTDATGFDSRPARDMSRSANADPPLGLCIECFRMRWIGEVVRTDPIVSGVCTQCVREREEDSCGASS